MKQQSRKQPVEVKTSMRLAFENAHVDLDNLPHDLVNSCAKALKRGAGIKKMRSMWRVNRGNKRRS